MESDIKIEFDRIKVEPDYDESDDLDQANIPNEIVKIEDLSDQKPLLDGKSDSDAIKDDNKSTKVEESSTDDFSTFKCPQCPFESMHKTSLKRHLSRHLSSSSNIDSFKCSECSYTSKYKTPFNRHYLLHQTSRTDVEVFKCSQCSFRTVYSDSLLKHSKQHQKIAKMYKCTECSYENMCHYKFRVHSLKHLKMSEIECFKCSECSFQTKYEGNLKAHKKIHLEGETFTCSQCVFTTKYKKCLERHISTQHGNFKCPECEYKCTNKMSLYKHKRKHMRNVNLKSN